MITKSLVDHLRLNFALDWDGIHGAPHWARVQQNGLRLAEKTGASTDVVKLFAFLHDSRRLDDYRDSGHGHRAAVFAKELRGRFFEVPDAQFALLLEACRGHSDGGIDADITVQTCWDADRLDLGRVGIRPHPDRLCTDAAREPSVIAWAYRRSTR